MRRALILAALFFAAVVPASAESYKLDGKTAKVTFVGTKINGKHSGGFKKLDGKATLDGDDMTTLKIELEIDTASLYSDNAKLTEHLSGPDFFGVKEFPKATFKVTKVEKTKPGKADKSDKDAKEAKVDKDSYTLTGDLTLLGKTKPVTMPGKVKIDGEQLVITSDFKIKRSEWGMTYKVGKKTGEIEDEVKLKVDVKAKK